MTRLRRAGYFKELPHGDPAGDSIYEHISSSPDPDAALIVTYLESGTMIAATSLYVDDYLDPTRRQVAPLTLRTDGVWVWPSDLAYYVATHHVQVPTDFREHMRQEAWRPRLLTDEEQVAIEDALFPRQF